LLVYIKEINKSFDNGKTFCVIENEMIVCNTNDNASQNEARKSGTK